jgi:hypothetical protein
MAKYTSHREDLMREATALVDRVEFLAPDNTAVVVGFRSDGACSVYFGDQPVYQFSSERKLRRAFDGEIIKAERGRLVRCHKVYQAVSVRMLATPLDPAEQSRMLEELHRRLVALREGIHSGAWISGRAVSQSKADVAARVLDWLAELPETQQIADTPHVR